MSLLLYSCCILVVFLYTFFIHPLPIKRVWTKFDHFGKNQHDEKCVKFESSKFQNILFKRKANLVLPLFRSIFTANVFRASIARCSGVFSSVSDEFRYWNKMFGLNYTIPCHIFLTSYKSLNLMNQSINKYSIRNYLCSIGSTHLKQNYIILVVWAKSRLKQLDVEFKTEGNNSVTIIYLHIIGTLLFCIMYVHRKTTPTVSYCYICHNFETNCFVVIDIVSFIFNPISQ